MEDYSIIKCRKCSNLHGFQDHMLPVVNFGNRNSPVLLISLNPSHREYKSINEKANSAPLYSPLSTGDDRTRATLTDQEIDQAVARQQSYFQTGEHLDWFKPAEEFLNMIYTKLWGELSFGLNAKANVNHIDIVKCPTNPTWNELRKKDKEQYINYCSIFLLPQIFKNNVELLIINGSSVYKTFKKLLGNYMYPVSTPIKIDLSNGKTCKIFKEKIIKPNSDKIIWLTGTSQRISSDHYGQFGNISDRKKVAYEIENLINTLGC